MIGRQIRLWASLVPEPHVWDLHDGEGIPAGCALASTHAPPPSTLSFTALTGSSTEEPLPPHLSLLLRSFREIGFYVAGGVLKRVPTQVFLEVSRVSTSSLLY